jgi:hypothetical protein
MKIVDSLLKFNFFLSGEVQENLSLFCRPTLSRQIGCKLDRAELGSVKGLIKAKHCEQSMQQFTHYGYDRLQTCFATTEQTLIESPQMRLVTESHQRRHVQCTTQMATAASADARPLFHRGTGSELRRVDPGEGDPLARDRHQWVRMRTRLQHTLQAIALNHGLRQGHALWSAAGRSALKVLPLPTYTRQRRNELLSLYAQLQKRIQELDQEAETKGQQRPQALRLLRIRVSVQ